MTDQRARVMIESERGSFPHEIEHAEKHTDDMLLPEDTCMHFELLNTQETHILLSDLLTCACCMA